MDFKDSLQALRREKGLSQEQLAEMLGISRQAISKWETGDAMPDLPKLLKLSEALNVSLDTLCGIECSDTCTESKTGTPKKFKSLLIIPGISLCLLLLVSAFFLGKWFVESWLTNDIPAAAAPEIVEDDPVSALPPLPDVIEVSGVRFQYNGYNLYYEFTPSVIGEGYSYQLTLSGRYRAKTYDVVDPSGGVCTGLIYDPNYDSYNVTVMISNGKESRAVNIASNLDFSAGLVSWQTE